MAKRAHRGFRTGLAVSARNHERAQRRPRDSVGQWPEWLDGVREWMQGATTTQLREALVWVRRCERFLERCLQQAEGEERQQPQPQPRRRPE